MSTNPDVTPGRASDSLVSDLSTWLAGHMSVEELRVRVERVPLAELTPEARELVEELRRELEGFQPGDPTAQLEVTVREAVEAVALGE